jgi:hypothetical protein
MDVARDRTKASKPRRTRQHVIASQSRHYVEGFIIDKGYTADRRRDDYGYDLIVETYDEDGHIENGEVRIQLNMVKRVTYAKLREALTSLGCRLVPTEKNHFVFRDSKRDLLILLPGGTDEQFVRPIDLISIRNQLVGHGAIRDDDDEFDSLFLIRKGDRLVGSDPKTGKVSRVTAAAGESDGLVVIKQNGALLPCPVNEVRRVQKAASASGK